MPNINLYDGLGISPDTPPPAVAADLDSRIRDLRAQGYTDTSGEIDQLLTAHSILSDPYKRDTYDAALVGPDGVVTVDWLHQLADQSSAAPASGPFPPVNGGAPVGVPVGAAQQYSPQMTAGMPGAQPAGNKVDLSTAGRTRTSSKMYLGFIVVIVLATLYPLFQWITFDLDSYDGGLDRSFVFIIANTIAWIGIAEIAWRIRTIFLSN